MYRVEDLIEKPAVEKAPSHIAVLGRYILTPAIFKALKTIGRGAGSEIQLTDALREVCRTRSIYARELEGSRFDIGDKFGCFKAGTEIGLLREEMRPKLLAYLEEVLKRESEEIAR